MLGCAEERRKILKVRMDAARATSPTVGEYSYSYAESSFPS